MHESLSLATLGRLHHAANRGDQPPPFGVFSEKLLLTRRSELVILELALAAVGRLPLGADPAFAFEAVERRIKRAVLDLQNVVRGSLDVLGDLVAVGGAEHERPQDEHVQCALHEIESAVCFFSGAHGRYTTLNKGRCSTIIFAKSDRRAQGRGLRGRGRSTVLTKSEKPQSFARAAKFCATKTAVDVQPLFLPK